MKAKKTPKLKRIFDIFASALALLVFSPLLLLLIILVRIKLGSPVFFRQERPGLNERLFSMYKFRSMNNMCDANGALLPDAVRLTKFGRFLRASSLDELPELWCVLKGEMSLVGPRPLLPAYLARYSAEQHRRHWVLPGITGWAQVNGRNAISWQEKFALDVWYVDNWSVWLDIKIMFLTVAKVFRRDGINAENQATVEEFMGNTSD